MNAAIILISFVLFTSTLALTGDECIAQTKIEAANLKTVILFYTEAFVLNDVSTVDRYISTDYIQHSPYVGDGQQPLRDLIALAGASNSTDSPEILRSAVSGDIVWLHVNMPGFKGDSWAVADIFRVGKDGKIVEHWDVTQEVPSLSESRNLHPMF